MARISLKDVTVDIPIFNSQGRSLKKAVMGMATGGKIGLTEAGRTIVRSLERINLEIQGEERVGLIGHNGAGKSTLLRVIGQVYYPTAGQAIVEGKLGSLIDVSLGIDGEATGIENIYLRAALLGIDKKTVNENIDEIIEFSELGRFVEMPVRTYSTGMHMRLAFAVSTMITPEILLMDEWLSVGDEGFRQKAETRLNRLIESSSILVIATHSQALIKKCCTRVVWLEHGQMIMDGKPDEVCPKYFK